MNAWLLLLSASAESAWKVSGQGLLCFLQKFLLLVQVRLGLAQLGFRGDAQFAFDLQAFSQLIGIFERAPGVFEFCLRLDLLFALIPQPLLKPTQFALATSSEAWTAPTRARTS